MTASLFRSSGLFSVFWPIFNNAVLWMVSVRPPIFKFSSPWWSFWVPPSTVGISVTFRFYSFFSQSTWTLFSFPLIFTPWSAGTVKSIIRQVLIFFFFVINLISWLGLGLSVCISKSQRILCISFSRADSGLYMYHSVEWVIFFLLQKFKVRSPYPPVMPSLIIFLR